GYGANFAMALDQEADRLLVGFRSPARLLVLSLADGAVVDDLKICASAENIATDPRRHRAYVICGAGVVDTLEAVAGSYHPIGQFHTVPAPQTGIFVSELDRLVVAVPKSGNEPAAIWLLRPAP